MEKETAQVVVVDTPGSAELPPLTGVATESLLDDDHARRWGPTRERDSNAFAVGYARALVEAVNADAKRTWLLGLDPASATPYADVPNQAEAAVDGLHARAQRLELVPVAGNFVWAEPEARVEVELQSAGPRTVPAHNPVTVWTGPLIERLGRGERYTPVAQSNGRVGLSLEHTAHGQGVGTARANVTLDWPATLAAGRSRVVAPRAAQILDWLIDGLPPVRTEVTVYTPGHPSPRVDGVRALFCDGARTALWRTLALRDARGRPLSVVFRREFEDRVLQAMTEVQCREVRIDERCVRASIHRPCPEPSRHVHHP